MREIPLTKGKVTLVDDEDFEYLNQWSWYISKNGYAVRTVYMGNYSGITIYMHRELLDATKEMQVDHINGDRLNNTKENLRLATNSQNCKNTKISSNNTSGYKGVSWHKKSQKFSSRIWVNYKSIHLGLFETAVDAAIAYNEAALKYHKDFARLNDVTVKN